MRKEKKLENGEKNIKLLGFIFFSILSVVVSMLGRIDNFGTYLDQMPLLYTMFGAGGIIVYIFSNIYIPILIWLIIFEIVDRFLNRNLSSVIFNRKVIIAYIVYVIIVIILSTKTNNDAIINGYAYGYLASFVFLILFWLFKELVSSSNLKKT